MDEADDSRTPDGASGALPDDDVEALLAQAESLASDLAAEAEVETGDRKASGEGAFEGDTSGVAQAADRASEELDEVDALLSSAEAEAEALFEAEKAEKAKKEAEATGDAGGGEGAYGLKDADLVGDVDVDLSEPGEKPPAAAKDSVKKAETAAKKAAKKAEAERKKREAAKQKEKEKAAKAASKKTKAEPEEEAVVDVTSMGRVQRVLYHSKRVFHHTVRGLRVTRRVVQNAVLELFIILDRPFADLSPKAKHILGVVGLITVVMGVLMWVLPKALDGNPYANMPPLPVKTPE